MLTKMDSKISTTQKAIQASCQLDPNIEKISLLEKE